MTKDNATARGENNAANQWKTQHLTVFVQNKLILWPYQSMWDFDKCDIRFSRLLNKKQYNSTLYFCNFHPFPLYYFSNPHFLLPSRKTIKADPFIFITSQTPFPQHLPHSSVSLILFFLILQAPNIQSAPSVLYKGNRNCVLCVHTRVWSWRILSVQ